MPCIFLVLTWNIPGESDSLSHTVGLLLGLQVSVRNPHSPCLCRPLDPFQPCRKALVVWLCFSLGLRQPALILQALQTHSILAFQSLGSTEALGGADHLPDPQTKAELKLFSSWIYQNPSRAFYQTPSLIHAPPPILPSSLEKVLASSSLGWREDHSRLVNIFPIYICPIPRLQLLTPKS